MEHQNEKAKELQKLEALISLMDDPDEGIVRQITEQIYVFGIDAVATLEKAWDNAFNPLVQSRLEDIIQHLQYTSLYTDFHNWYLQGGTDLLKGFMLLSKLRYPDLNESDIMHQIGQLTQDVWLELNKDLTALAKIRVMNHIFYEVHGFNGNLTKIGAPANNYINQLLETRKGNPLSLGILYLIIAQSLKIPVFGINLPQHFIIGYANEQRVGHEIKVDATRIRFYINAFRQGKIFSRSDIEEFLTQMNIKHEARFFLPCDNITMIKRLIANLILAYEAEGEPARVEELKKLAKALN
ncbi:MAG: transglutaminase-like domain-containing protein [Bacteroidales bacterium]|nr:transglutaminase-like domain-containing protein [Bacteroidales bacterium]MDD2324084.1 transglutaminase-like domain-containing protein [Bacteroidales bacterium]MDD3011824.1 transglutaminase-like domain-containing protein [Bacteroidales bacterium]MDD3961581.1 transglutaminase-like domain-containing protein [Bacteroidales bacterium]MDY0285570.1 transglutaminase-like domain-containing protein [Bacteroidales bacterium]